METCIARALSRQLPASFFQEERLTAAEPPIDFEEGVGGEVVHAKRNRVDKRHAGEKPMAEIARQNAMVCKKY